MIELLQTTEPVILVMGVLLLVCSYLDLKYKEIPSILLTSMLIMTFTVFSNHLYFGIFALLFAILLYEFDYFKGIADIKMTVLLGLMTNSYIQVAIFLGLVVFFGLVWKSLYKWKFKKEKEVAFVPVFLFVYITMLLSGLFIYG